jgi:hypothetical protein
MASKQEVQQYLKELKVKMEILDNLKSAVTRASKHENQ